MAIDPADLKKISELIEEVNKSFDQVSAVEDGVGGIPKKMTRRTTERSRVVNEIDGTGGGVVIADFTDYDSIEITIDQDTGIQITNLEDQERGFLKILKPNASIATFGGDLGFQQVESFQKNISELLYEVTTMTTSGDIAIWLTPLNDQLSQELDAVDLTPDVGNIIALNFFKSTLNRNIGHVEVDLLYAPGATVSDVTIDISGWDVDFEESTGTSGGAVAIENSVMIPCSYTIDKTELRVYFGTDISLSTAIKLSGTFKVI